MPRGFLVKRSKRAPTMSYRVRSIDDDCLFDLSTAEKDIYQSKESQYLQPFNSPDSGYGHSPRTQSMSPTKEEMIEVADGVVADEVPSPTINTLLSSAALTRGGSYPSSPTLPAARVPMSAPPPYRPLKRSAEEMILTEPRKQPSSRSKKPKAARRITFDDDNRSPVHGTIIKQLSDEEAEASASRKPLGLGGDYMCKLCREEYPDPLSLAQHKCSRIVHVEYRCPECDKVFNCPANLASHRRWHKPKPAAGPPSEAEKPRPPAKGVTETRGVTDITNDSVNPGNKHSISTLLGQDSNPTDQTCTKAKGDDFYQCDKCNKRFRRPANLRRHLQQHSGDEESYPCHYCGEGFSSLIARTTHMFSHAIPGHQSATTFQSSIVNCRVCGLAFGDGVALAQHERHHHRMREQPVPNAPISPHLFPCKYCSTIFSDSGSLSAHINKRHPTEHRRSLLLNVPVRV